MLLSSTVVSSDDSMFDGDVWLSEREYDCE
jgi:hypothetical protein